MKLYCANQKVNKYNKFQLAILQDAKAVGERLVDEVIEFAHLNPN